MSVPVRAPLASDVGAGVGIGGGASRWPILLCGFIAGLAGGVAFMQSPLGATPEVQSIVTSARASATSAWRATVAFVRHFGEVGDVGD